MKYRKKPIIIEAVKYQKDHIGKLLDFCDKLTYDPYENEYYVQTLEDSVLLRNGDYVIKGVKGEFYPCREDIFLQCYEKIKE